MKKNKKAAGGMTFEVLIKLLLGLIILAGVFYFLFGNYILDYFKNLPGNKYDNKDPPVTNISKDNLVLITYYKVGVILDGKYIKLCTKGDCNNLRDTKLYLKGDDKKGDIYVDINWAIDKKIGGMINAKFVVDRDILAGTGSYENIKNELPYYSDLRNLDNSIYISGIFYRDKEYVVGEQEKVFGSRFNYMEKDDDSFGNKAVSLEDKEVLIVYINYVTGDFKITEVQLERTGDYFKVFATYRDSEGNQKTDLMDCNKKGWTWQTKYLSLYDVKDSLTTTLDLNCKM